MRNLLRWTQLGAGGLLCAIALAILIPGFTTPSSYIALALWAIGVALVMSAEDPE